MPAASNPDDFAPGGSARSRRGRGPKDEGLPPGRRNQRTPTPVNPEAHGPAETPRVTGDGPRSRARAAAAARRAAEAQGAPDPEAVAAALQAPAKKPVRGKLAPVEEPIEPEIVPEPEEPEDYEEYRQIAFAPDPVTELQTALMFALRLRILGEDVEGSGTWEDFDQIAVDALRLSAPDPFETMTPAQRFLWGDGSIATYEETENPQIGDVADIVNLGQSE